MKTKAATAAAPKAPSVTAQEVGDHMNMITTMALKINDLDTRINDCNKVLACMMNERQSMKKHYAELLPKTALILAPLESA